MAILVLFWEQKSRYCNNAEKGVYNALEFKKWRQKNIFSVGIPTVEFKKSIWD